MRAAGRLDRPLTLTSPAPARLVCSRGSRKRAGRVFSRPRMNHQYGRTLQDTVTTLAAPDVLAAAKRFFSTRPGIYNAYPEKEGPTFVSMRGQGGEEVIVGVTADLRGTRVTGSSYMFDAQVARFLGTLPPAPEAAPSADLPVTFDPLTSDAAPPGGTSVAAPPAPASAAAARVGGSPG